MLSSLHHHPLAEALGGEWPGHVAALLGFSDGDAKEQRGHGPPKGASKPGAPRLAPVFCSLKVPPVSQSCWCPLALWPVCVSGIVHLLIGSKCEKVGNEVPHFTSRHRGAGQLEASSPISGVKVNSEEITHREGRGSDVSFTSLFTAILAEFLALSRDLRGKAAN